ncbi:MAG: hypothetical protein V1835_01025 [Candidatus Micrarchaeota archaeon]
MGLKFAAFSIFIIWLSGTSDSISVLNQFNSSDYILSRGTYYSGSLSDTYVSDNVSLGILEAGYNLDGMAVFQLSVSATAAQYQQWRYDGWSGTAAASTPATAGTLRFNVLKSNPARNEKILVTLDSNSDVDAQIWNGYAWTSTTEMTASASIATKRAYDAAYEQVSGRALVAFANTTAATVTYRLWDGNSWTANGHLNIGTAGVTNRIINLVPKPNSNEMMMLVSDGTAIPKLYAIFWNGTGFNASTSLKISDSIDGTSDEESYYGVWEEISGNFNVYYSSDAAFTNVLMATFSGGSWGSEVLGGTGGDGDLRYVKAAGFPGTNRQMICWKEWTAGDINCQTYNGTDFGTIIADNTTETGVVGRNFDVAPLLNTDGGFVIMYGDTNDDWFDFMVCTSGTNCDSGIFSTRILWSTTQLGGTDTQWGQIYADPYNYGNFTLVGVSQTAAQGWFRARIYCDTNACAQTQAWTGFGATTATTYEAGYFTFNNDKFHRSEILHNSTATAASVPASKTLNFINVTARVNSTIAKNYSLNIYDWVSGSWNVCSEQTMEANMFSNMVCNITASTANYRSQDSDGYVKIMLNGTYNFSSQGIIGEDYLQYYLGFEDYPLFYDGEADKIGVTNSTPVPGQGITIYSLWYDDASLSQFWLEHNATGVFENQTPLAFSDSNNSWGNYSLVIPSNAEGKGFFARIWANDSAGQLNVTANITINVQDAAPDVGNTSVDSASVLPYEIICVNASASDAGIGIDAVWALVTYPNDTASNITLSDTGCNAGIAGDGRYGMLINVSGTVGNFTVNTTFANDSRNNLNSEFPFPQLRVNVAYPPNPIGGSNYYVGFYGNEESRIVNQSEGSVSMYVSKIPTGTLYAAKSGASISWGKLRIADNTTDMPAMDTELGLTLQYDKLETYFSNLFDIDYPSLGGMVTFQSSAAATTAQYQTWNGTDWSATAAASTPPVTAGTVQFTRIRSCPNRDEKMLITLDSNNDIDAQIWNGSSWSATTEMTAVASVNNRDVIDIGYERISGNALIVYANTTTQTIAYRVWDGIDFSSQYGFAIGTAGVTNRILDLFPREGTNDIMLLLSDGSATPDLYAILWQNGAFNFSTQVQITTELDTTSDYQSYFGDWEEQSGDFNVFYGEDTQLTIFRRSFEGGSWTAPVAGASGGDGDVRFTRTITFPGTDRQMVCWKEWTAGDVNCQYYDGSSFGTLFSNDTTEIGTVARNFDVAPLLNTDGGFVVMFGGLNDDWYSFMVCTSAANCMAGNFNFISLWSTTQLGGTDTAWGKLFADPNKPGEFVLLGNSQTAANGWYRARIYCDAASCSQVDAWTNLAASSSAAYESGSFTFDRHQLYRTSRPPCGFNETYFLNSSDYNWAIGVLYSDEDSSGAYTGGDNIIFCTDFNVNKPDAMGGTSDYEIVFPKSFSGSVDLYFEA